MKTLFAICLVLGISMSLSEFALTQPLLQFSFKIPYGNNPKVGKYFKVNGTNLYCEIYGEGEPLLLIHGNGGSIEHMGYQIDYFSSRYKVIVPDCRGRGKSDLATDSLTYEQLSIDMIKLLDNLGIDSCDIIGWSDGGIVGLIMGMNYPARTKKIVAMGANIWSDTTSLSPADIEKVKVARREANAMITENDKSKNWKVIYQLMALMDDQPNIKLSDLKKIKSPVLIVAGDRDIIKTEHTVLIFSNIPKSQLWIIPVGTHFAPVEKHELFNSTVNEFLH
jgi:pimeloyl-ACP methyl ester carboxylesterase